MSCLLGSATPDGWLWARITDAARSFIGPANTSRGCANETSSRPIVTVRLAIKLPPLPSDKHTKYSCRLLRIKPRQARTSSVEVRSFALFINNHSAAFRHPARQHMQLFFIELVGYVYRWTNRRKPNEVFGGRECDV